MKPTLTMPRAALAQAIESVAGASDNHSSEPSHSHVRIAYDVAQGLEVNASDGIYYATLRDVAPTLVRAKPERAGVWIVKASTLRALLKHAPGDSQGDVSLQDDPIDGKPEAGHTANGVILRIGEDEFKLATLGQDAWVAPQPADQEEQASAVSAVVDAAALHQAVQCTAFAMPAADLRHYLVGTLFDLDTRDLTLVATNGSRMAIAKLDRVLQAPAPAASASRTSAILPRRAMLDLQRQLANTDARQARITISARSIRVVLGGLELNSRVVQGQYPQYRSVMDIQESARVSLETAPLGSALAAAAVLAWQKMPGVRLLAQADLAGGMLHIQASNSDSREGAHLKLGASTFVGVNSPEVAVNADYLIDAVRHLPAKQATIVMPDSVDRALHVCAQSLGNPGGQASDGASQSDPGTDHTPDRDLDRERSALDVRHIIMPMRL